jgi:hypothetical protein
MGCPGDGSGLLLRCWSPNAKHGAHSQRNQPTQPPPPARFGVRQREQLARNVGHPVHTLLMTATPIPRTLALVMYGSLVLSSINEMPPGRRPIETRVVLDDAAGREQVGARGGRLGWGGERKQAASG